MSGTSFSSVYQLANLTAPASGVTHAAEWLVQITAGTPTTLNMLSQQEFLGDFLGQAMTYDNSTGATPVVIQETTYGWTETIQAGEKRTFQYPGCPNQNFIFNSSGNVTGILSVYDWPAFPDSSSNLTFASGTPVTIVGQPIGVTDTATELNTTPGVVLTDRSVALTGTGAAVPIMAANAARKTLYVAPAVDPTTGTPIATWVSFDGAVPAIAGLGSVNLATLTSPLFPYFVTTGAVSVWDDATLYATGGNLTAWEG